LCIQQKLVMELVLMLQMKKQFKTPLSYKSRREGKPFSVVMPKKEMAAKYVELNDMAENLYDNYLPGPDNCCF
jgi:tRNA A37 threonylcarbamoyladenosine synthetase subunit TsaC/SUA5/YrdC